MIKNEVQLTERPFTSTSYNGDGTFAGVSWGSPTTHASKTTVLHNKRKVGQKQFELSNHLGNVVAVVTDRKIGIDDAGFTQTSGNYKYNSYLNEYYYYGTGGTHTTNGTPDNNIDYYLANTISYTEYYAFGSEMPNRSASDFRFGFNGKEKLDEWHNTDGAAYDFGARVYDSRVGRFMSIDRMASAVPFESPYSFALNSPIYFIDEDGNLPTPYEAALMSRHVYGFALMGNVTLPGGWRVSNRNFGITLNDPNTGFKSRVYERVDNNGNVLEYTYVTAGTDDPNDWVEDALANFAIEQQYSQAIQNAEKIKLQMRGMELSFAGHSLGGGLASANALATGLQAITFNPMAMTNLLKIHLGIFLKSGRNLVKNYIIYGEAVNFFQHTMLGVQYTGKVNYLYDARMLIPIYNNYVMFENHTIDRVIEELEDENMVNSFESSSNYMMKAIKQNLLTYMQANKKQSKPPVNTGSGDGSGEKAGRKGRGKGIRIKF